VPFLKIPPEISAALGGYLRGQREVVVNALTVLRDRLENNYDTYKSDRNKEDNRYFNYRLRILDLDYNWHTFLFVIDDSLASGYLLISGLSHKLG